MKIILGGRGSGKTAELIRHSAATQTYIMVNNQTKARYLADKAKAMGIDNMPYPVTWKEYCRSDKFTGSSIREKGLLIDDLDMLLRDIFLGIPIHGVTMTSYDVDKLNDRIDWTKKNPYIDWEDLNERR